MLRPDRPHKHDPAVTAPPRCSLHAATLFTRPRWPPNATLFSLPDNPFQPFLRGSTDTKSVADFLGPWVEPDFKSSLIARCREAWNRPFRDLTRLELATLIEQKFVVEHVLPVARKKLHEADDDTEMFDGQLAEAIEYASKAA
jgi:hypothetical protein